MGSTRIESIIATVALALGAWGLPGAVDSAVRQRPGMWNRMFPRKTRGMTMLVRRPYCAIVGAAGAGAAPPEGPRTRMFPWPDRPCGGALSPRRSFLPWTKSSVRIVQAARLRGRISALSPSLSFTIIPRMTEGASPAWQRDRRRARSRRATKLRTRDSPLEPARPELAGRPRGVHDSRRTTCSTASCPASLAPVGLGKSTLARN
jgi:hypothetical protein